MCATVDVEVPSQVVGESKIRFVSLHQGDTFAVCVCACVRVCECDQMRVVTKETQALRFMFVSVLTKVMRTLTRKSKGPIAVTRGTSRCPEGLMGGNF